MMNTRFIGRCVFQRVTCLLIISSLILISAVAQANDFHPAVPLLDQAGELVIQSGRPLSTMSTCGSCHDVAFIESSSDHADAGAGQMGLQNTPHSWQAGPGFFGGWDPLRYDNAVTTDGKVDVQAWLTQSGARHIGGGPVSELVEMDCLLCHSDITDQPERREALQSGNYQWANSLALAQKDVLRKSGQTWVWNPEKFREDGSLEQGLLKIRKPSDENCGQCHGQVNSDLEPPLMVHSDPAQRSMTDRSGQIITAQKLSNTGMNIAGKELLTHAFDVHADRIVGCVDCHYSLNNPVYFQQREESRPQHLDFDPRRLSSADYLQRPLHQFAKGKSTHGLAAVSSENSLRRCESCHDASRVHQWLPYRERHFSSLACESCHIPKLYGPALQSLDWTFVDQAGNPQRQYRNTQGNPASADGLIQGFSPVILARQDSRGQEKLAPFNLVTAWYWLVGDPLSPIGREQLVQALYPEGTLHPNLLKVLDDDADGLLNDVERRLDSADRANAVRQHLLDQGFENTQLSSEVVPFSISHNVVNGRWATRDCSACHGENSRIAAVFNLSDYQPGGLLPVIGSYAGISMQGDILAREDGGVDFVADSRASGFYIIGLHGLTWVDQLGLLMFFGILLGISGHALVRLFFNRRRARVKKEPLAEPASRVVYMYDRYERLWHWLQACAILILLATGLVIHKPHIFGMFSFSYMVNVHNVLGFILLINAALALFYNLASGEIRQYLPEPKGFIGRSIAQAMYYSRGIFAGKSHPLEKTKEHKLNPLQQITYLAILNILLPAQVITGVLIWGLQKWPDLATALGGLPVLAPIHTLVAWAFSAFIVMHVYLTTAAGDTPAAGIKSMVSGWEKVEQHRPATRDQKKEV